MKAPRFDVMNKIAATIYTIFVAYRNLRTRYLPSEERNKKIAIAVLFLRSNEIILPTKFWKILIVE